MTTRAGNRAAAQHSAAAAVVVQCTDVSRTFGAGPTAVHAMREVSCRVPQWARIALTGPSGSGKSALLHLIAGLDTPTAGSVQWPALEGPHPGGPTGIGMAFQGPSLLPSLDVTENVALPLLFAEKPHQEAMHHARATLDLVEIGDLAAKLPDELAGGQAQRVAIARVLATRPAVILADEPTGQLDHPTADRVITILLDAAVSIGAAVIIATHDPAIAARLPDQWVMRDGLLHTRTHTDCPPDMITTWLLGLLRRRMGRLTMTATGIAAAVALLACLGSFLSTAQHSMTARALRSVAVDWQVEVQPNTAASAVLDTVHSTPTVTAALPVGFAKSTGFVAQTGASTQTTGPATELGIPPNYRAQFPDAIRTLVGAVCGVLMFSRSSGRAAHARHGSIPWR